MADLRMLLLYAILLVAASVAVLATCEAAILAVKGVEWLLKSY